MLKYAALNFEQKLKFQVFEFSRPKKDFLNI